MRRLVLPILSLAALLSAPAGGQPSATRPDSGPAAAAEVVATPATVAATNPATVAATMGAQTAPPDTARPAAPIPAALPSPPPSRPAASPVAGPAPGPTTRPVDGSGPLAAGPAAAAPALAWADYQIIVSRNIFSRDRGRRGPIGPNIDFRRPPEPPSGDNYVVLTGTLVQGDLHLALFEDGRTGQTSMVAEGHPYLNGTVVSISLDHVEYRTEQGLRTVAIGQNLRGVEMPVYLAAALPTTAPASTQPATGAALEPTTLPSGVLPLVRPPGMSMEEWMRLRRLQETR
jgi:hypothetical protein